MAQYDVVANPDPATSSRAPYLIVLQHDLLAQLPTVVVAPLVKEAFSPVPHLNPKIPVGSQTFYLSTAELFATRRNRLGERVANAADLHDALVRATDLIFTGF